MTASTGSVVTTKFEVYVTRARTADDLTEAELIHAIGDLPDCAQLVVECVHEHAPTPSAMPDGRWRSLRADPVSGTGNGHQERESGASAALADR